MLAKKFTISPLPLILLAFIIIGTFRLDSIPGEWFSDISIVNDYVLSILAGKFPFYFVTSAGPLYFYLIAPLIAAFGVSYLNYKLISVAAGALGLLTFYLFAKEIATKNIAVLTTLITAFSFWYIVWARLGNYNIITPAITALMMYFFIKYTKSHKLKWLSLSIFISCLGLFIYAGTFLLPLVLFVLLLYPMIVERKTFEAKRLFTILFLYLPATAVFIFLILHSQENFTSGYLGTKIFNNEKLLAQDFLPRLLTNITRTATMLHIEGDIVFRWNISKMPLLDRVSGIFFLIGLIYTFFKQKKYLPYILIPLLLLPIPSLFPGHPPVEIPSSPRTMAIMPFVFLFIAYGLESTRLILKKSRLTVLSMPVTVISLILIIYLNLNNYFVLYPPGLPNKNTPFGKIIAEYIDSEPTGTTIYLASLGWGDWAQPSYDGIYWALKNKKRVIINGTPNCYQDEPQFFSVILAPNQDNQIYALQSCFPKAKIQQHITNGQVVFYSLTNPQAR